MGTSDGSIIAAIITTHIARNDAAAAIQVCPGIRIQAIDIVQPPGICIPPIADMDAHHATVSAALPEKSSAEVPKKTCCETRSELTDRFLPQQNFGSSGSRTCTPFVFCLTPSLRGTRGIGQDVEPSWVRRGLGVVIVVPVPPLVWRVLGIARGGVLPGFLTPERRDVEIAPRRAHRLIAAVV